MAATAEAGTGIWKKRRHVFLNGGGRQNLNCAAWSCPTTRLTTANRCPHQDNNNKANLPLIATGSFPRHRNRLLAALPDGALQALPPDLEWVEMPSGRALHDAGVPLDHVYFPGSAVVSVVSTLRDGVAIEAASIDFEGLVGLEAFLLAPGGANHGSTLVQSAARAAKCG